MSAKKIAIALSTDEALVLFDWLSRISDGETTTSELAGTAEERVLWSIEGQLQTQLVEPLDPNYKTLLSEAHERVLRSEQT